MSTETVKRMEQPGKMPTLAPARAARVRRTAWVLVALAGVFYCGFILVVGWR